MSKPQWRPSAPKIPCPRCGFPGHLYKGDTGRMFVRHLSNKRHAQFYRYCWLTAEEAAAQEKSA